jgi:hypothetical protein
MTPDLLHRAQNLHRDIKYMEDFIKAIPRTNGANALAAISVLYQDYHDIAIDYLNSDLLEVLLKAQKMAEGHLAELKKQFERLE